jgi:glycosyltransferase involved in cell wall biosynthesis
MKILWLNTNFMHPPNKGGVIRTLEMLRHLSRRHEIHYAALEKPSQPEGPRRAGEYSFRSYSIRHRIPERGSPRFALQVLAGLFSPLPLAMQRFESPELGRFLEKLLRQERFDRAVVDHLTPASYYPDLAHSLLFQHNVETVIWRRHMEHAADPLRRLYFNLQARRMYEFEGRVCRTVGRIVAVSRADADHMRDLFGVSNISEIPTGVNLEYYRPQTVAPAADLVFVGSMDWLPNIDGVNWFVREVLPLIRKRAPGCSLAIAGRSPGAGIRQFAAGDPRILVTGTVPDVRPYLWGSGISIVPLRIGGGTRLKIYESMAAKVPVVSTTIGAEGLEYTAGDNIRIGDGAEAFAGQCLELLNDPAARERQAASGWEMVNARFSWEQVSRCFESALELAPRPAW